MPESSVGTPRSRLRFSLHGLVQGVGFRPFVHRLAHDLDLAGLVRNTAAGALVEVEGPPAALDSFRRRLFAEAPPPCAILHVESAPLPVTGEAGFAIHESAVAGPRTALILPDLATCPECLREIFDPADRRHRYPFANCTRCGPRYSIVESLPYDRAGTSMRHFTLCPACRREFEDPADRRFHAQPIACPLCGPRLALQAIDGACLAVGEAALAGAVAAVRAGHIVALKGLGGFQLVVRADDEAAVARLRARKRREAKPLALLFPSLAAIQEACVVSVEERRLLESPAAPIVLLERRTRLSQPAPICLAPSVALGSPWFGAMLPYTPLHHLLLADLQQPVVATSGNVSDEPMCIDDDEARHRLGDIADIFLVHDRPIVRPVDDSVARVICGTEQVLRRARGFAPLPVTLPGISAPGPVVVGLGAHLKNTIAVARDDLAFVSQHIGDLETPAAAAAFEATLNDLPRLLDATPAVAATDPHPDYFSTQRASRLPVRSVAVPHHEAHAHACLAEHGLEPPALALSWDGTGLGPDGTIWGGEFLELTATACTRRATLRPFPLPGGDAAARDPRRSLLGVLIAGDLVDTPPARAWLAAQSWGRDSAVLRAAAARGIGSPRTTSLGRLFDALAALLGLAGHSRFEGEAAMAVEWAALQARRDGKAPWPPLAFEIRPVDPLWHLDWAPLVATLLTRSPELPAAAIALSFHHALVTAAVDIARLVGQSRVALTGGCFQNRLLTELLVEALRTHGFSVYWHQRIPPNDGGIALGQVVAARRELRRTEDPG